MKALLAAPNLLSRNSCFLIRPGLLCLFFSEEWP